METHKTYAAFEIGERQIEKIVNTSANLLQVIRQAGGNPLDTIKYSNWLKTLSMFDFIYNLAAPNHISFLYNPPINKENRNENSKSEV